jgi:hypothetical protein
LVVWTNTLVQRMSDVFEILPVFTSTPGVFMGIAVFSRSPLRAPLLSVLLSPLQALSTFLRPARPVPALPAFVAAARCPAAGEAKNAIKTVAANARHTKATSQKPCQTLAKATSPRRLKVVRELEAGASPSCAGRMVISGRMADVCAELDRMAQREAAIHAAC